MRGQNQACAPTAMGRGYQCGPLTVEQGEHNAASAGEKGHNHKGADSTDLVQVFVIEGGHIVNCSGGASEWRGTERTRSGTGGGGEKRPPPRTVNGDGPGLDLEEAHLRVIGISLDDGPS